MTVFRRFRMTAPHSRLTANSVFGNALAHAAALDR